MGNSDFFIGPVKFAHQVQDISIQETKAVEVIQTTRTSKNLLSDTGKSVQKAVVRLLVTGLSEINNELRKLIALFRCCPITSVSNEMISSQWSIMGNLVDTLSAVNDLESENSVNATKLAKFFEQVPVAIEELSISTAPDLPFSLYVTITLVRIDVRSIYRDGVIKYKGQAGEEVVSPRNAFYLNKWINKLLDDNIIPALTEDDFENIKIVWKGEFLTGEEIAAPGGMDVIYLSNNPDSRLVSESTSIRNLYAYHNIIGAPAPLPHHMGSTSRFCSLDLLFTPNFDNLASLDLDSFAVFKELSDAIARARERGTRVAGWVVTSPINKLLSDGEDGTFVPLYITTETTTTPGVKTVRLDLAESNLKYFEGAEVLLSQGGTDYDSLKNFFNKIADNEYSFRKLLRNNPSELAKALSGQNSGKVTDSSTLFDAYSVFWPVVNGNVNFFPPESYGLLNRDTLKAALVDPIIDHNDQLQIALAETVLISGAVRTGAKLPSVFTRASFNITELQNAFLGPDKNYPEFKKVLDIIISYTNKIIVEDPEAPGSPGRIQEIRDTVASYLFYAVLGDYSSALDFSNESGQAVQFLSKNGNMFGQDFKDALFSAIVKRKNPPESVPGLYKTDGLLSAFTKLIIAYTGDKDTRPESDIQDSLENQFFRKSVYEDLLLPSYYTLYGDEWESHAPTYADIGQINPYVQESIYGGSDRAQSEVSVSKEDKVSPSAWFFVEKYKSRLESNLKTGAKLNTALSQELTISLPFGVDDINAIEAYHNSMNLEPNKFKKEGLDKIIVGALKRAQISNPEIFSQSLNQLGAAFNDEQEKQIMKNGVVVYVHNMHNFVGRRKLTTAGVAAEIYRVASELKLLRPSDRLPRVDTDNGMRSSDRTEEYEFIRNLSENTEAIIKSDLDQTPDIFDSPIKMFPAIKVYLLEKRGTELYGDDSFFSVNPVVSVDITQDKDDADLAVITIADPLFLLQNSFFPPGNIATNNKINLMPTDDEMGQPAPIRTVLGSLKGNSTGGYLKRFKITEGRAVQIRMGYDSTPDNLKTVFTGRIVEIQPGDTLTIVCQGWKAELINRQVNFYNDNTKNWGARDLALMAIQRANPDGFGDFYPQQTSDFLLKNLQNIDVQELVKTVLRKQEGFTSVNGSYDIGGAISNYIKELFGFDSLSKRNTGIDTRIKNIWWPDLPSYNNILGWRSTFGVMPSQANDSWIVPLQPAWEVLKEASRHAWNSIVQVVPFDGEATIFFGCPDQPYYYTKGRNKSKEKWQKYLNSKNNFLDQSKQLLDGFKSSKLYDNNQSLSGIETILKNTELLSIKAKGVRGSLESIGIIDSDILSSPNSIVDKLRTYTLTGGRSQIIEYIPKVGEPSYKNLLSLLSAFEASRDSSYQLAQTDFGEAVADYILEVFEQSSKPSIALAELRERLGSRTTSIIMKLLYNIPEDIILSSWPGIESELPRMIQSTLDISPEEIRSIKSQIPTITNLDNVRRMNLVDSFLNPSGALLESKILQDIPEEERFELSTDTISVNQIKLFVYFFNEYLKSDEQAAVIADKVRSDYLGLLPPNMRVFRQHHWIDSTRDIIQNNIVASTKDMWNTVVVEHPAQAEATSKIESEDELFRAGDFFSGIKWVYWPKNEVSGVVGLQFHPGLTLANKKIKVFTELNCQSNELAAKLACTHLADGIRRMYRGNLMVTGRCVKPHDRIILDDEYNKIAGPLEIESVIHHWSVDTGWVTNIAPQAVCDANPGAAILQTAALEDTYNIVFKAIDYAADISTYALIIATLGGGTALGPGAFNVKQALTHTLKNLISKDRFKYVVNRVKAIRTPLREAQAIFRVAGASPAKVLGGAWKKYGGLAASAALNFTISGGARQLSNSAFRLHTVNSFVANAQKVEQLPVVLCPLLYNGLPFLAGMETDDPVWAVHFNNAFHSLRQINQAGEQIIDSILTTIRDSGR